ncbi:MAG: helix-turn-helix transcriptional regulator [Symploca sp. SIO2E9]|nr:helix-turn-helix transcriptional regulator [Symploca sp. SIO2E9]
MGTMIFKFKEMRNSRKISQEGLARKLGISVAYYRKIEGQKIQLLNIEVLIGVCKILQCQPGDLFEYVENEETA